MENSTLPGFEAFDRRSAPRSTEPVVTIQKKGTMSLNEAAYAAIGSPEAVELLYNATEKVVALRAVETGHKNAYPLRPTGSRSKTFMLSGISFTNYYGIDTSVGRRYRPTVESGVILVDLKGDSVEVRSNRTKAKTGDS